MFNQNFKDQLIIYINMFNFNNLTNYNTKNIKALKTSNDAMKGG